MRPALPTLLALALPACGEAPAPREAEAAPAAVAAPPAYPPGSLAAHYIALRETGCDPGRISAPLIARALRNTPFAMAGRPFTSPDLTALFSADGGWYAPHAEPAEVTLAPADAACVASLQAHERVLRRQVCMDDATQATLTGDHDALLWLLERGLPGLIEGTPPTAWADPGFDACASGPAPAGARFPWSSNRWNVALDPVTSAEQGLAVLAMPENIDLMGIDMPSAADLAQLRRDMGAWLAAGRQVRGLAVEVLAEDHPSEDESYEGQVVRRCVGPDGLLGGEWFCWGYSLP
ncbi:MAG: YARHG domain-containing protein [Pseudomonadota bacterium]